MHLLPTFASKSLEKSKIKKNEKTELLQLIIN